MANYQFRYGDGTIQFDYPEEEVLRVLEPNQVDIPLRQEDEIIRDAIEHPIGSPKLEEIVTAGQTVCIVVPDVTRLWSRPAAICRVLVEKLNKIGVPDENILFIAAVGTHRLQEEEDFIQLIGEDLYKRIKIENHLCDGDVVETGVSSYGNVMQVNAHAIPSDFGWRRGVPFSGRLWRRQKNRFAWHLQPFHHQFQP